MSSSGSTAAKNKHCGSSEAEEIHVEYEWTIKNFRLFSHENGKCIYPPIFSAKENDTVKWKLQFHPRGRTKDDSDYVSLYLYLDSCDPAEPKVSVHSELSIFKSENIHFKASFTHTYVEQNSWGYNKMMERSKLLGSCSSDDSFTIRCKVDLSQRIITKPVNPVYFNLNRGQMNEHYSQLFNDLKFCDITIIVGKEKFPAHKLILAVRSTVFAAMFEHKEMEENRKNEVKIEDMEPATVKGMLEFLYKDEVTDLETLAQGLLRASDKYDLYRLKTMCEEVLYKTLTIDNAAEILVLSDLYHSDKLKEYVMAYIDDHLSSVIQSESYESMVGTYPALLNGLMSFIATRRESKK